MTEPQPALSGAPGSPDWIAEAIRNARAELVLFVRTAVACSLHPGRFAAEWSAGKLHALNPLAFLATSAAALSAARLVLATLFKLPSADEGLLAQIADALGPYAHYAALGLVAHLVFRLSGSRAPLRESLGVALFAGGGPAAMSELLLRIIGAILASRAGGTTTLSPDGAWQTTLIVTASISFSVFSFAFCSGMAAIHRVGGAMGRTVRVTSAILAAYLSTGLFFGLVDPPGHYGLHFELRPHLTLERGTPSLRLNFGLKA
jgi:hypothetical protein